MHNLTAANPQHHRRPERSDPGCWSRCQYCRRGYHHGRRMRRGLPARDRAKMFALLWSLRRQPAAEAVRGDMLIYRDALADAVQQAAGDGALPAVNQEPGVAERAPRGEVAVMVASSRRWSTVRVLHRRAILPLRRARIGWLILAR